MTGELNLSIIFHRPAYQSMDTPQQAYLLLEALPAGQQVGGEIQPVNLCLVLDRSGSMAGEKLDHLKAAASWVVDRLGMADYLSVVIFDDADPAERVLPAGPVTDHQAVQAKIAAIQERGGTHMSTGMRLGLEELRRGHSPQRVSSMLLVTDGQTWEDQQICRELADQCRASGIPINVIGLGIGAQSNWDPRLLEDLAQRSGGEWTAVESIAHVEKVFEKLLHTVQGTAVTNAKLTLRMVEGLSPRAVWRVTPMISRLGHQTVGKHDVQIFLGDVQYGAGQAVLADIMLPPRKPGDYRVLQADITYDSPANGLLGQRISQDVTLTFTEDAVLAAQTDQRLMNLIERVVAHRLQTQALDEAAAGDVAHATQRLRSAATRLLELGEVELAQQANQQAQKMERNGQVDLAASQKMRYATKRLTEMDY